MDMEDNPKLTCECRVQATSACRVRAKRDRPLVLGLFAGVATPLDRWPTDYDPTLNSHITVAASFPYLPSCPEDTTCLLKCRMQDSQLKNI